MESFAVRTTLRGEKGMVTCTRLFAKFVAMCVPLERSLGLGMFGARPGESPPRCAPY